jgi:hypothetical protein
MLLTTTKEIIILNFDAITNMETTKISPCAN